MGCSFGKMCCSSSLLFILLYLIKPLSSMSRHTRACLLSACSKQQEFLPDRWLNPSSDRFTVDRCSACSDVQSICTKVIQTVMASMYQQFSFQDNCAHIMLVGCSTFLSFFFFNKTKGLIRNRKVEILILLYCIVNIMRTL